MHPSSAEPPTITARADDPLIGTIIGDRYRVEAELGSGGMGTVYRAEHVLMEKRVALKVLHPNLAVVGTVMDRFQREAVALSRIEHPNVVSATDFGKLKNGAYYLALEYVDGRNLAQVLQLEGRFEARRALTIAAQIAQALCAAHGHGIVHRDLKPHNVMLTKNAVGQEVVKVLDFGLAKLRSKTIEGSTANIGAVFGTPHYMAPEQVASTDVDGRADLYSLGIILYEMLSGRRPFDAESPNQVLDLQLSQPPHPLPEHIPQVARELVNDLLQKAPELRPQSAEVVSQRILVLLTPPPSEEPEPWLHGEVQFGSLAVPRWGLLLPAIVFVAIFGVSLIVKKQADDPAIATTTAAVPAAAAEAQPPAERLPQVIAQAEFGEEQALQELKAIPPAERSRDIWLVLAQGLISSKQPLEALTVYRQALQHDPGLLEDDVVSKAVRNLAADSDAEVARTAINLAAEALGTRGVDILFSVWSETSRRTPETALAQRHLEQQAVLKRGSPSVQLALALRTQEDCAEVRKLLVQAKTIGDSRSLRPMAGMRKTRGCGRAKQDDCYPCLRQDELLEDAIKAASERTAPRY